MSARCPFKVVDEAVHFLIWCCPVKLAVCVLDVTIEGRDRRVNQISHIRPPYLYLQFKSLQPRINCANNFIPLHQPNLPCQEHGHHPRLDLPRLGQLAFQRGNFDVYVAQDFRDGI
jgi:hypothetical protein